MLLGQLVSVPIFIGFRVLDDTYEGGYTRTQPALDTTILAQPLRFMRSPKWADSVVSRGDHDGLAPGVEAVRSRRIISKFGNCGRTRGTHFPGADAIDPPRDAGHSICGGLVLDVRSRARKLVFWPGCRRKFSLRACRRGAFDVISGVRSRCSRLRGSGAARASVAHGDPAAVRQPR